MIRCLHLLLPLLASWAPAAECIAHRGDSIRHADNTLEAIGSAWKAGADIVEVDVRMTADGVLVLFHDADLHKQAVSGMTHAALDAALPGHRVPTLEDLLASSEAGQRLLLDLKGRSRPFLDQVLKVVGGGTPPGCRVLLQSTDLKVLDYLREHSASGTQLFYVTDLKGREKAVRLASMLAKRGLQGISAKGRKFVDKAYVETFHGRGLKYFVWTINTPDRIRHYVGLGVDGVITDDPVAFRKVVPAARPQRTLPLPGEVFEVGGHTAFLIRPEPETSAGTVPWVWYAPTLPGLPGRHETWMFEQWLERGIAIAGVDVGESYGSPDGRRAYQALYLELTRRRGMATDPCLLARSRGGLMLYNWAAEHPQQVSAIAGIYPVCNLLSHPGLAKACGAYGMNEPQLKAALAVHNPVDRLAPLARAGVPIFHLHGDKDDLVPLADHSGLLFQRYTRMGGKMTLKVIEGGGHDLRPHWFRSREMVEFVAESVRSSR